MISSCEIGIRPSYFAPHIVPDKKAALRHVELITGLPSTEVYLRFLDSGKKVMPAIELKGTIEKLWPEITKLQSQKYCVFLIVNAGAAKPKQQMRDEDITAIRACFIDGDGISEPDIWHKLPAFLVHTSPGKFHAYWPMDDLFVPEFEYMQRQLAAHYGTDTSVCNPSRIMRLAGTLHFKNPETPHLVTLDDRSADRERWELGYTADELRDGLSALPAKTERSPSPLAGEPMSVEQLRNTVAYLEPDAPRPEWRDNIAGIHAAPIPDDDDESQRLQVALEYSHGELDRLGRYKEHLPSLYTSDEDVEKIFNDMPPKADGVKVGTIIHRAREAGYRGPTSIAEAKSNADFRRMGEKVARQQQQEKSTGLPFLLTEDDIFNWPDPEELIDGFLMRGENVCLFGQPKIGKTFIALEIALSIAAELPVFGKLAVRKTGPVVYLSGEGHAGMKRRIKAWRQARGIPADRRLPFYYKANVPATAAGMSECQRYVEGIRNQIGEPILLINDTMARSMAGLNENDAGDVGRYLELTEGLRSGLNCTILTLAHSGKEEDRGIRGSSASTAGFDAVWSAEMSAATKIVKIESKWLKDSEELGPFCFRLKPVYVEGMKNGKGAVIEPVALEDFNKSTEGETKEARRRIYDALTQYGAIGAENGLTTREFAERLIGQPPRESDRKAYQQWETAVCKEVERLDNNSRPRKGKKEPLYLGYSERTTREGSTRLFRLWFLPEPDEMEVSDAE